MATPATLSPHPQRYRHARHARHAIATPGGATGVESGAGALLAGAKFTVFPQEGGREGSPATKARRTVEARARRRLLRPLVGAATTTAGPGRPPPPPSSGASIAAAMSQNTIDASLSIILYARPPTCLVDDNLTFAGARGRLVPYVLK